MNIVIESNQNNSGGGSSNNADIHHNHSSPLFCCQPHEKVSLGSLKKSIIKENANTFNHHKIPVSFFNGLETLIISGYEDSMSLFSSSIAANLVSLRVLSIRKCDEMVQVIRDEEEKAVNRGDQKTTLVFPTLVELRMSYLLKLESFCDWNCDVGFPSLRKVTITMCLNLKSFNLAAPNLEDFTTDNLLNYLQDGVLNVSFDSLKILTVEGNEKPLYSYKIHASFFIGLQQLKMHGYEGNMSLFSSSIARNLVNLRELEIYDCKEMVKVIEDEKEEENVVSAGAQTTKTILFPKLQALMLAHLWKLVSFCEWKCDVELPSLRKVEIWGCPDMKNFTLGSLTTPNLESVRIEFKDLSDERKDLNGMLKQYLQSLGPLTTPRFEIIQIQNEYVDGEKDLNGELKQPYLALVTMQTAEVATENEAAGRAAFQRNIY
ncbi:hypothetical protein C2S51_029572 [Perilla frutescens var. frutescens]|nr:hypothetical protein C2S51_029572 [Perilla frutescens var. frutescens]